ncbi:MAG: hypothetical protein OJF47_001484 [Nitrospira sp.]|nr:MAG: hypothetical protein OJF47_001484 [Nitrospira sp.]
MNGRKAPGPESRRSPLTNLRLVTVFLHGFMEVEPTPF